MPEMQEGIRARRPHTLPFLRVPYTGEVAASFQEEGKSEVDKMIKKPRAEPSIGRIASDFILPVAGDIDMYNRRRDSFNPQTYSNYTRREALFDMVPSLMLKYGTFAIAGYHILSTMGK